MHVGVGVCMCMCMCVSWGERGTSCTTDSLYVVEEVHMAIRTHACAMHAFETLGSPGVRLVLVVAGLGGAVGVVFAEEVENLPAESPAQAAFCTYTRMCLLAVWLA